MDAAKQGKAPQENCLVRAFMKAEKIFRKMRQAPSAQTPQEHKHAGQRKGALKEKSQHICRCEDAWSQRMHSLTCRAAHPSCCMCHLACRHGTGTCLTCALPTCHFHASTIVEGLEDLVALVGALEVWVDNNRL